jgi:hypothetical protein
MIQKVESFAPHSRRDLDYTAEAGWYEQGGCKTRVGSTVGPRRYISLQEPDSTADAIHEQALADQGARPWAFSDPLQVAQESLRPFYGEQLPTLHLKRKTPVRQVFRLDLGTKCIAVVVTKPYWLSFYAKSDSVAWVATAINEVNK